MTTISFLDPLPEQALAINSVAASIAAITTVKTLLSLFIRRSSLLLNNFLVCVFIMPHFFAFDKMQFFEKVDYLTLLCPPLFTIRDR